MCCDCSDSPAPLPCPHPKHSVLFTPIANEGCRSRSLGFGCFLHLAPTLTPGAREHGGGSGKAHVCNLTPPRVWASLQEIHGLSSGPALTAEPVCGGPRGYSGWLSPVTSCPGLLCLSLCVAEPHCPCCPRITEAQMKPTHLPHSSCFTQPRPGLPDNRQNPDPQEGTRPRSTNTFSSVPPCLQPPACAVPLQPPAQDWSPLQSPGLPSLPGPHC